MKSDGEEECRDLESLEEWEADKQEADEQEAGILSAGTSWLESCTRMGMLRPCCG